MGPLPFIVYLNVLDIRITIYIYISKFADVDWVTLISNVKIFVWIKRKKKRTSPAGHHGRLMANIIKKKRKGSAERQKK